MSATISSAEEFKAASERARILARGEQGTEAVAEAADWAAAMRKWEEAQDALDEAGHE